MTDWQPMDAGCLACEIGMCDEHEDEDSYSCLKCGQTVQPWHVHGCEACGDPHPWAEPEPPTWFCTVCGVDGYESLTDAENCCAGDPE